jgi:signal transduction histidine kinase
LPELKKENLVEIIDDFCQYLKKRISAKVFLEFVKPKEASIPIMLNRYLFEWVIENLVKNSVDAISGEGLILIRVISDNKVVHIDIQDNGKGIPAKLQKQIFNPGYTSKSRGWGLGLTLAKRIVKEYHKGKLFVKSSTPNVGTVMRITLNLS